MTESMPFQITKWDDTEKYVKQTGIVAMVLAMPEHSLDELLRMMRSEKHAALYLLGSRLDSSYCFGSGDVGILISVLPEDEMKAAEPGFHPASTETYVTFQGILTMELLENGQVKEKNLGRNDVLVLPPGQCHRVRSNGEQQVASLIVKTNLRSKPGAVRCDSCTLYPESKSACPLSQNWEADPLHQRWEAERQRNTQIEQTPAMVRSNSPVQGAGIAIGELSSSQKETV